MNIYLFTEVEVYVQPLEISSSYRDSFQILSSSTWYRALWWLGADVPGEYTSPMFRVECAIAGFLCEVDAVCDLMGYYAAYSGISFPTFRDNLLVPSSRVKKSWPLNYHHTPRASQMIADLFRLEDVSPRLKALFYVTELSIEVTTFISVMS